MVTVVLRVIDQARVVAIGAAYQLVRAATSVASTAELNGTLVLHGVHVPVVGRSGYRAIVVERDESTCIVDYVGTRTGGSHAPSERVGQEEVGLTGDDAAIVVHIAVEVMASTS